MNEFVLITEPDATYQNLGHTKNVKINDNIMISCGRAAILVQYTDGFRINDNLIDSVATETDNERSAINCSSNAKNGKIFNNTIRKALTGNQNKYGVEVTASCTNVQTFNNDAEGKTGRHINNSVGGFEGWYAHSPDGTRYKVAVANGGTFTVTAG